MNNNQNIEARRNRIRKLSDSIFGNAEEIERDEAEETLRVAGLDPEAFANEIYARLYKQAQEYWMANKPLPPLLKIAIEQLRPMTAPPRNEDDLATQARARVEHTVERARSFPLWAGSTAQEFQATAYRNKGELTEKDKRTLDDITKRLNDKLKGPRS
jgi:hypothetical protein